MAGRWQSMREEGEWCKDTIRLLKLIDHMKMSFWNAYDVLNVLTEVALVAWPSILVIHIQTSLGRRFVIIACFACRLL